MQATLPTQAARQLLAQYAEALNSANTDLLPALYTTDGVFMPDGVAALPASALLGKGQRFFAKMRFHISYKVKTVAVDGTYAFVQATAHTVTTRWPRGRKSRTPVRIFSCCNSRTTAGKSSATSSTACASSSRQLLLS